MNGEGQLEPSFGWRATRVMSLRGFQLFHLRSKRKQRLLLLPLFFLLSLTFYTLTSFDSGWGRKRRGNDCQWEPDCLQQAPTAQTFLEVTSRCFCTHFVWIFFIIKLLFPVHKGFTQDFKKSLSFKFWKVLTISKFSIMGLNFHFVHPLTFFCFYLFFRINHWHCVEPELREFICCYFTAAKIRRILSLKAVSPKPGEEICSWNWIFLVCLDN